MERYSQHKDLIGLTSMTSRKPTNYCMEANNGLGVMRVMLVLKSVHNIGRKMNWLTPGKVILLIVINASLVGRMATICCPQKVFG